VRLVKLLIESEVDFWKLIWQSVDLTRFLTPVGQCRTLRCVLDRPKNYNVSLEELADPRARPDITRNTEWFRPCVRLARNFDWRRFEGHISPSSSKHQVPVPAIARSRV
jgi:hypothetical protein